MKLINTYTLEIKKSKFIAYYYEVHTKEDIDNILGYLKKNIKKQDIYPMHIKLII